MEYEKKYKDLLKDIFNGSTTPHVMRDDRTGVGCVSKFSCHNNIYTFYNILPK